MNKQLSNVLILGCGRSGTSIFGELFDHLSEYTYLSEPDFDSLYGKKEPIAVKVPRSSQKRADTEGLSFPLAELDSTSDRPWKIFWIVRHPLDAISSLKIGISRNWGHHPRPTDWKEWSDRSLVARCAHHWDFINSQGYDHVKNRATLFRFEDMILDPMSFSNNIVEVLELDMDVNRTNLGNWSARVKNQPITEKEEAKTSRVYSTNDHKVKVGRWRENLTTQEISIAIPQMQETAIKFGYNL